MTTERFSMKEWKPEQVYDKIQRAQHLKASLENEKIPLIDEKRIIEAELNEYNVKLRGLPYGEKNYNDLNSKRGQLVKKKAEIETKISEIKKKLQKVNSEIDSCKIDLKKRPNEAVQELLFELRDKYLSFSADTTRVSSMRAMASKFVEEIQIILKAIP